MVHLYKAARETGLLSHAWDDMDFAIAQQNRIDRFVITSQMGMRGFARLFSVALGVDAMTRTKKPRLPKADHLRPKASVRLACQAARFQLEMQQNTRPSSAPSLHEQEAPLRALAQVLGKGPGTDRDEPLSTAELLNVVKTSLAEDDLGIKFDWLGLRGVC